MKKVFIPIIVLLVLGCLGIAALWQLTYQDLEASQNQVQLLAEEVKQHLEIMEKQKQELWSLDYIITTQTTALEQKQEKIGLLNAQNSVLIQQVNTAKFTFYYDSLRKPRYGIYGLASYLNRWQWTGATYIPHEFDCSEMATYLEYKLENEGYHTILVFSDSPHGSGYHAWLLVQVETNPATYMPVEPTVPCIIYWENPYFDNYYVYLESYETIQGALGAGLGIAALEAFDWWNQ